MFKSILNQVKVKRELRRQKINEARERFTSWLEVSNSQGWKVYESAVSKKIDIIKDRLANDISLSGEDLKRLQLAHQVWKEVQRIPKILEENARKGISKNENV